jgi:hypothetical protein
MPGVKLKQTYTKTVLGLIPISMVSLSLEKVHGHPPPMPHFRGSFQTLFILAGRSSTHDHASFRPFHGPWST